MSLYIDEKFFLEIAHTLEGLRKKSNYIYNFRCPLCGDSKRKKFKTRGYIYRDGDSLKFKCHNDGIALTFGSFLHTLDPLLYKQYVYETFLDTYNQQPNQQSNKSKEYKDKENRIQETFKSSKKKSTTKPLELLGCSSIASLSSDHHARMYVESRQIPKKFLTDIYWTDDFKAIATEICETEGQKLRKEGRIVIPFLNRNREVVVIQGRSLDDNGIRYITIKASEDASKLFGVERLDEELSKRIYVVEGPFDSLFLPNCLALAGSDIPSTLPIDNTVIVYDNEPRKPDTCEKILKAIGKGFRVCIWPDKIKEKDINLMIINGYKASRIREIIDKNTFIGLEAQFKLQTWRKD